MAKSKYLLHPNHPLRSLIYIILALGLVVGGIATFKASQTSTEGRSKAAEIISILNPSWEFNQNGNSEGWEGMNYGFQISGGLLGGTILGRPVPLPLSQSLEVKEEKNNKSKKQNKNIISDNSGPGMPITNAESYVVNNSVNKELPPGLKGVNLRMAVSTPDGGNSIGESGQSVSANSTRVITDESSRGNNRKSRNNCTECKFGKFCPLFIDKIPGFCPAPSPIPRPSCTPMPPPCEGPKCPKFPTVIPPGDWCPPQPPKNLTFRLEYSAGNTLPQATPRVIGGNSISQPKPFTKPLYFDVTADGQMHEYQIQFPNIDKFDLRNLKIVFYGASAGTKISFDYIRLVSLAEIKPSVPPVVKNPVNWTTDSVSLIADNFYIDVGEKRFYMKPDPNTGVTMGPIGSPNANMFTSLEVSWREYGIDMKVYLYFNKDNNHWWLSELKTYNGLTPGDWISYGNINGISGILGEKFIANNLNLYSTSNVYKGAIYFENLILQSFINIDPRATLAPSSAPIPITTKACTQEAKRCSNGTYVSRTGPNCEFETCPQ